MTEELMDIIAATVLFQGIDQNEIAAMLDCIKPKFCCYNRNEYIAIAGDDFEGVGVLLAGEAAVSKENAAGNRTVMTMLEPGDIFGEMIAFSSQSAWPATVQAQTACTALFLPRGRIIGECAKMCPRHRSLIQNFLRIISEKALMLNKKVEYLTIKSLRGRVSLYLLEEFRKTGNRNILLPLKRNELADFLNVSRPSLSRELCAMRDEGFIDFHKNAFRILDLEALKTMSGL